uniref:Sensory transduction histidine kinase n=1 Tax=Rheinheimera sp. BAL341 TaxID=1708203 RepID=A0A486XT98_9GAMM
MQASFSQLLHIHQTIDPIDNLITLCQRSCELLSQTLQLPDQVLYLNHQQQLQQVAAAGAKFAPGSGVLSPLSLAYGEGVVGLAAQQAQSLCIADTRVMPNYICDDASRAAELSVPIVYKGEILGVLDAEHAQIGFFGTAQQQFTEAFAAILGPRLANLMARRRLAKRSYNLSQLAGKRKQALLPAPNWLDQNEFNNTILQALKHFYCEKRWQHSPLSRLALLQYEVISQQSLKRHLIAAIDGMQQHTATALWGNILYARYLDKQDQLTLAEKHFMAFSTLRCHQHLAQQHLLQQLWHKELLQR